MKNCPVFLNISNHPSSGWGEEQTAAALKLCRWENADGDIIAEGKIIDIPFPTVPATAGTNEINRLAESLYSAILGVIDPAQSTDDPDCPPATIHLMGEQAVCYCLTSHLRKMGLRVVVSSTEREVVEKDGVKTSVFRFVRFRALDEARFMSIQ